MCATKHQLACRQDTENILKTECDFLVRGYKQDPGSYVLSRRYKGVVSHAVIKKTGDKFRFVILINFFFW